MKIVGVSGAVIGEKTAKAVEAVLQEVRKQNNEVETELLDMREYDVEIVVGKPLASYNEDTQAIVAKIIEADVVIFGTPVYQASITGVLKNLFDHLPTTALKGKVAGMVTTAGSKSHLLVTEYQLKPILSFFKTHIATNNVFLHTSCFNEQNEIVDEDVQRRIVSLADEVVTLQNKLNG
ncbi:MAG: NADPH-dependent FMN reductase [Bacillus sp. (in: firmicutes)]